MIGIKYLIFTECFLNNKTTILRTSCKKKKELRVYIILLNLSNNAIRYILLLFPP